MKLSQNVIDKIFRTSTADIPTISLARENVDVAIPFVLKTGFVNTTEVGVIFDNDISDYGQFQRIWTGYEAVLAKWEDSTSTVLTGDFPNKVLTKKFETGRVLPIWFDNRREEDRISNEGTDTGFVTEEVVQTIKAYSKEILKPKDIVNFYTFPNKTGETFFYIDYVVTYNDPNTNEFKYSEINFISVNDRLSNTGLAVNQYIQKSAPGEGYAYPLSLPITDWKDLNKGKKYDNFNLLPTNLPNGSIVFAKHYEGSPYYTKLEKVNGVWNALANESGVILDKFKLRNQPVTSFQMEIFGKGVLSDIYFYGRPVKTLADSNGEIITQPRLLLLNEGKQPDTTQRDPDEPYARNTGYKYLAKSRLVVESWYKSWKEQADTQANPAYTKKYMGALEVFYGDATTKVNINPTARFFGDLFSFGIAEAFWPTTVEFQKQNNSIVYDLKPNNQGLYDFSSLFFTNFLKNKSVPRLPLSYKESVAWSLTDIPLIGGFLNSMTAGLVRQWRDTTDLGGKNYNIAGIIATDLMDFYQDALMAPQKDENNQAYTSIPLDDLQSESSPITLSKTDFATIINYTLTDTFGNKDVNGVVKEIKFTKDFGYVGADGKLITQWDSNQSQAINSSEEGFAIDLFGLHFVGDGDIKVTYFNNGTPIYTTKVKTLSSLTESVRDWNSNYKQSDWSSPAGSVADNRSPYRFTSSDFTIDLTAAEQKNLANNFGAGYQQPVYQTNSQGNVELDSNGNPIIKVDSNGNPLFKQVSNRLDTQGQPIPEVDSFAKTSINSLTDETLIFEPSLILDYRNESQSENPYIYSRSLKQILEDYKYGDSYIKDYSFITFDLEFSSSADSGGNTANNIFSFGKSGVDKDGSNSFKNIRFEIFDDFTGSYDVRLSSGQNEPKSEFIMSNTQDDSVVSFGLSSNGLFSVNSSTESDPFSRVHYFRIKITNVRLQA